MGTLITGYVIAWAAVTIYVSSLAAKHIRLNRRLQELEARLEQQTASDPERAHAA
jgi:CcmD family protein